MKINTYAVNCNDAWLNTEGDDISGSYVKYKDHQDVVAELEAKCAALAAENGQMLRLLTDISENHDEYVNQDDYLYAGIPMDYVSEINAYVSRDVEAENPFKETDAFLAEVRASAVEGVIAELKQLAERSEREAPIAAEHHRSAALYLQLFAAQLRQGAAQ